MPRRPTNSNGFLGNSLTRAIAGIDSGLIAKEVDTGGYCDNGTPRIVVPVTKLENWLAPRDVPAGVVIYNGSTGELYYRPEVVSGELPGLAISISQSRRVNASLSTLNGDWWSARVLKSTGITDEPKDEDDTNLGSHSNFSLNYGEGKFGLFSPFTSRASFTHHRPRRGARQLARDSGIKRLLEALHASKPSAVERRHRG